MCYYGSIVRNADDVDQKGQKRELIDPMSGIKSVGRDIHPVFDEPYTCRFRHDKHQSCDYELDGDGRREYGRKSTLLPFAHFKGNETRDGSRERA